MPQLYLDMRDSCIKRKEKSTGKPCPVGSKAYKNCQKMAAIMYYKQTGKPVTHDDSKATACINDIIELDILAEQLDVFGTLEEYDNWNQEKGEIHDTSS